MTLALIASALQLSVNQLRITRLHLLARSTQTGANEPNYITRNDPIAGAGLDTNTNNRVGVVEVDIASIRTFPSTQRCIPNIHTLLKLRVQLHHHVRPDPAGRRPRKLPAEPHIGSMSAVLPVRRLSDDEYLAALEKQRKEVDGRLREIAAEEEKISEGMTRA